MSEGIRRCGDSPLELQEEFYNGPVYDVAVFYGLKGKCRQAFVDYRRMGRRAVYIDLGYWGRTEGGKIYGYHKIAVNDRHPTSYFQKTKHPPDRFQHFRLAIKPWRSGGRHILVAGMGAKAAAVEGFIPNGWEQAAIAELRHHTDRPIIYRPKPSWRSPEGIDGVDYSPRTQSLSDIFEDCHAVVSHHSNVCVDALLEGIPVFCVQGVASIMGKRALSDIENPLYPDNRAQWAWDIAYTQWRSCEMKIGHAWQHLKDDGLI